MKTSIYLMDLSALSDETQFEYWLETVDPSRRDRIRRMKNTKAAGQSLGAGILIREGLKEAGLSEYRILAGEHGKPYVEGRKDVFFNVAHSGDMAVFIVSDCEVGIDIEKVREFDEKMLRRIFTDDDLKVIRELEELPEFKRTSNCSSGKEPNYSGRDAAATLLWTVKESVMKFTGLGLSMDPRKIKVRIDTEKKEGSKIQLVAVKGGSIEPVEAKYEDFSAAVMHATFLDGSGDEKRLLCKSSIIDGNYCLTTCTGGK